MNRIFTGLLLAASLFFCATAFAAPFVVCDPQQDAHGYLFSIDGGEWEEVPYHEFVASDGVTYALITDVGGVTEGPHDIEVMAFADDPTWGRLTSSSVPLSFVRPGSGEIYGVSTPTGLKVVR